VTLAASAARLWAAPEITIQPETALIAVVGAFGQAQLGFHHATARTCFGGGIPAVREHDAATGPAGFVLDLESEFAHRPSVPSLIPSSRATCAIGLPVSRTIRTAPSRNSRSKFRRSIAVTSS
jgi:hypothetical protein